MWWNFYEQLKTEACRSLKTLILYIYIYIRYIYIYNKIKRSEYWNASCNLIWQHYLCYLLSCVNFKTVKQFSASCSFSSLFCYWYFTYWYTAWLCCPSEGLHRLEKWANRGLVQRARAIKEQCKILQRRGKNNPTHQQRRWPYGLESSFVEKNAEVLVNTKLTVASNTHPCGKTSPLGCVRKKTCHQQVERDAASLVPQGDGFWSAVPSRGLPSARELNGAEWVRWKTAKVLQGPEHLWCRERLKELGWVVLSGEEEARGRSSRCVQMPGVWATEEWHRSPREAVESRS